MNFSYCNNTCMMPWRMLIRRFSAFLGLLQCRLLPWYSLFVSVTSSLRNMVIITLQRCRLGGSSVSLWTWTSPFQVDLYSIGWPCSPVTAFIANPLVSRLLPAPLAGSCCRFDATKMHPTSYPDTSLAWNLHNAETEAPPARSLEITECKPHGQHSHRFWTLSKSQQ